MGEPSSPIFYFINMEVYILPYDRKLNRLFDIIDNGYKSNNHDELVSKLFISKKPNKITCLSSKLKKSLNKYQNISNYLLHRYNDSLTIYETLIRMFYHIETLPKCQCGNSLHIVEVKDNSLKFNKFCSTKCASVYSTDKIKETKLKRYGNAGYSNIEKRKKTNLIKYGVTCVMNTEEQKLKNKIRYDEIQQKRIETLKSKYGEYYIYDAIKKREITMLSKYNVKSVFQLDEVKEKRYIAQRSYSEYKKKEIQEKRYNTMKSNHTFNTSKPEEELYLYIKEKFPSVVRQYKDTRYPFCCDFYIPELDYFIELNGSWTHGSHPYNSNSEEDKALLEKMQTNALSGHKYYFNAIKTWVERDPYKREIAKQNNLHFKEVWTLDEGKKFIDELGQ